MAMRILILEIIIDDKSIIVMKNFFREGVVVIKFGASVTNLLSLKLCFLVVMNRFKLKLSVMCRFRA